MQKRNKTEKIFVLVLVQSGIPVDVEAFRELKTAQSRNQKLRKDLNFDNDETGIFEVIIDKKSEYLESIIMKKVTQPTIPE